MALWVVVALHDDLSSDPQYSYKHQLGTVAHLQSQCTLEAEIPEASYLVRLAEKLSVQRHPDYKVKSH